MFMMDDLTFKIVNGDSEYALAEIIKLLKADELGSAREKSEEEIDQAYVNAFRAIIKDPNQALIVVERNSKIIGTCHLTFMPSLTMIGTTRMNIEAVRISESLRGQKIGEWMINRAVDYAKIRGAGLIQLTTNIKRPRAKNFYEKLGFEATHVGMKLKI